MCGALRDAAKKAEKLRLESERALLRKLGRDEGDGQQYCDEDMKGQLKYSARTDRFVGRYGQHHLPPR